MTRPIRRSESSPLTPCEAQILELVGSLSRQGSAVTSRLLSTALHGHAGAWSAVDKTLQRLRRLGLVGAVEAPPTMPWAWFRTEKSSGGSDFHSPPPPIQTSATGGRHE